MSPLLLSDNHLTPVAFVFLSGLRNSVWVWCQQTRPDIIISQSNEKNSWPLSHGRRILAANLNALECCFLFVRWIVSANEANADLTHSGWSSPVWVGSYSHHHSSAEKAFRDNSSQLTFGNHMSAAAFQHGLPPQHHLPAILQYLIIFRKEAILCFMLTYKPKKKRLIILICEPRPPNWTSTVQAGWEMMSTTQGGSPVNVALRKHYPSVTKKWMCACIRSSLLQVQGNATIVTHHAAFWVTHYVWEN